MQNQNQFPKFHTTNLFNDSFANFEKTRLFKRLNSKFQPKPYYQKYIVLRWVTLIASYLFNVFSAITASTLIFYFVDSLTGYKTLSFLATGIFIVLMEISKRKTNSTMFKDWLQFRKISFGLLAVIVLLLSLSVTFSYFGSKKLVNEFHHAPTLSVVDTLTTPIVQQIQEIDNQIKQARATRWHGTTTSTSQRTIESLSKQKLPLQERLLSIENRNDDTNIKTAKSHQKAVYVKAENFALVTLLLEALFILCAFYLELYDYRSFVEFSNVKPIPLQAPILERSDKILLPTEPKPIPKNNMLKSLQNGIRMNGTVNGTHKDEKEVHTKKRIEGERLCNNCSKDISTKWLDAKYCSERCRRLSWEKKNGREPYLKSKK